MAAPSPAEVALLHSLRTGRVQQRSIGTVVAVDGHQLTQQRGSLLDGPTVSDRQRAAIVSRLRRLTA